MTIKLTQLIIFQFLFASISFSQEYTHVYYMDGSFASVEKEKAVFICKGYRDGERFKLDCFNKTMDGIVLSAYFADSTLSVLDGQYRQYYGLNQLQNQGNYQNNLKQGVWEDWNAYGQKTDSAFYDKGLRLRYVQYTYIENYNVANNGLYSYSFKDSLLNDIYSIYYSDSGIQTGKMTTTGDSSVWTHTNNGINVTDTVFNTVEVQAEFPGGAGAWVRYLEKTLGGFHPADHGAGNGRWQVIVKFIVDKDGTISNVLPETNFGHKMEETVVRIILNGPKWKPAIIHNKPVKAFRRQPVTFIVEGM